MGDNDDDDDDDGFAFRVHNFSVSVWSSEFKLQFV